MSFGLRSDGPADEFGEPVLRLKDPDNIIIKLAGARDLKSPAAWDGAGVPVEHAVQRVRGVTMLTEKPAASRDFVEHHFGYRFQANHGNIDRLVSQSGDIVDIRNAQGFWSGAPGTGTADHVAFRAADEKQLHKVHDALKEDGAVGDEPARSQILQIALCPRAGRHADRTGDRQARHDGGRAGSRRSAQSSSFPKDPITDLKDLKVVLPQFSMPGEPRVNYRDLPFVHRFYTPPDPDGSVFVLLHGSGGNETTLMPLLHKVAPRATLLGVRGRATEEGLPRWYKRITPFSFDQDDIKSEAEAFAAFIEGAGQILWPGSEEDRLCRLFQWREPAELAPLPASEPGAQGGSAALHAGPEDVSACRSEGHRPACHQRQDGCLRQICQRARSAAEDVRSDRRFGRHLRRTRSRRR